MKRKKNFKKKALLSLLILLMFGMGIGYAALNSSLFVTGVSTISKNSWDVHFENVLITDGSVEADIEPEILDDVVCDFEVTLAQPGDFYEFTIDVVNNGTIDAMLNEVVISPELTEAQAKYLDYSVTYANGNALAKNQALKQDSYVRLLVRVEYKSDVDAADLPTEEESLLYDFTLEYVQSNESAVEVENHGRSVNTFTFLDVEYEFLEEMTWGEFLESDYNVDEAFIIGTIDGEEVVVKANTGYLVLNYDELSFQYLDDLIISGHEYQLFNI